MNNIKLIDTSANVLALKKQFSCELKAIYWSEKRLLKLLPKLTKASSTKYLKASFKGHLYATKTQVGRLEQIFKLVNEKVIAKKCLIMEGLFIEVNNTIKTTEKNTRLRDLGLITIARQIEHYEIYKYERLKDLADSLEQFNITGLIENTLIEEREAEETFMAIKEDTLIDDEFKVINENSEEFESSELIEELQYI